MTAVTSSTSTTGAQLVATSKGGSSTLIDAILGLVIIIVMVAIGFAIWKRKDLKGR
jgi:hypothetical protein